MQQGGQEALAGSYSREQEKWVPLCEPQSLESSLGAFSLVLGDGTAPHAGKHVLSLRPLEPFSLTQLACGVCL